SRSRIEIQRAGPGCRALDRNVEGLFRNWTFGVGRWTFGVFFDSFFRRLLQEALLPQSRVFSSQLEERRVGPSFDDPSPFKDEDLVRTQNRREPMRDHETGPVRHQM